MLSTNGISGDLIRISLLIASSLLSPGVLYYKYMVYDKELPEWVRHNVVFLLALHGSGPYTRWAAGPHIFSLITQLYNYIEFNVPFTIVILV